MQRTSFVVHLIDDDPIHPEKIFNVISRSFLNSYLDVREFTPEEYMTINKPDVVE